MDRTNYETICALALNRIFGYEPAAGRRLIGRFGSPGAVFSQSKETLDEAFGPFSKHRTAICEAALEQAEAELGMLESSACRFIHAWQDDYPPLLSECPDAPIGLYIRSDTAPGKLFSPQAVSVVGTRDLSPYGKEWTEKIVGAISCTRTRPAIVSGFAMGVDITAHLAALAFGLPTIAVLPVGIDDIYPRRHSTIAGKLARTPGCALVTDFPPGTSPVAFNFLRRNRIIAGLSRATILVESKEKGGGTMTARLAASYGRELFCLPGRIDDIRSQGCNRLLREKLAEPITDLNTIGRQLGLGSSRGGGRDNLEARLRSCYGGTAPQALETIVSIALLVRENRGCTAEDISARLGLGIGDVSAALCLLESDGFINTDLLGQCTVSTTNF